MSWLIAAWDWLIAAWDWIRRPTVEPYMPPLAISVDLVRLNLAVDASDEGQDRAKEDLMRLVRGYPTRRQLRLQIENDRQMERIERMRAGQLEAFAR